MRYTEDMSLSGAIVWGCVHPLGRAVSFDEPFRGTLGGEPFEFAVIDGHFTVRISVRTTEDVPTFINEVTSTVQAVVDAFGFHVGLAPRVEVQGAFIVDGERNVAVYPDPLRFPEAAGATRDDPMRVDRDALEPYTWAALSEPAVAHALADINMSIARPTDTAFHAYRACDAAREWFQRHDPHEEAVEQEKTGWHRLHGHTDTTQSDFDELKVLADARRHGRSAPITEAQRLDAIRLARKVVAGLVDRISAVGDAPPER